MSKYARDGTYLDFAHVLETAFCGLLRSLFQPSAPSFLDVFYTAKRLTILGEKKTDGNTAICTGNHWKKTTLNTYCPLSGVPVGRTHISASLRNALRAYRDILKSGLILSSIDMPCTITRPLLCSRATFVEYWCCSSLHQWRQLCRTRSI